MLPALGAFSPAGKQLLPRKAAGYLWCPHPSPAQVSDGGLLWLPAVIFGVTGQSVIPNPSWAGQGGREELLAAPPGFGGDG